MGNCLKTQLKQAVNNDNLPYFNAITISNMVKGYPDSYLGFSSPNGTVTVEIISGTGGLTKRVNTVETTGLTEVEITNLKSCMVYPTSPSDNNPVKVKIKGLENLTKLECGAYYTTQISSFSQCENLTDLEVGTNFTGGLADLANIPSLVTINTRGAINGSWTPDGLIDDYYDALFEKEKYGTYYMKISSAFKYVPHSNKFATVGYGQYTIVVNSEGWTATFA